MTVEITRQPITSSSVESFGYDAESMTLEVAFHANKTGTQSVWRYSPVSQRDVDAMTAPGASFGAVINVLKNDPSIERVKVSPVTA